MHASVVLLFVHPIYIPYQFSISACHLAILSFRLTCALYFDFFFQLRSKKRFMSKIGGK
jgi:hypothetical protein